MKPQRIFIPPVWMTLVFTALGVFGTSLVYKSVVHGEWVSGVVGGLFLVLAVVVLGTPLAYARYAKKLAKSS